MYDLISNIIDHSWINTGAGEQSVVYYICGALIIMVVAVLIDLLYRLFSHFWR